MVSWEAMELNGYCRTSWSQASARTRAQIGPIWCLTMKRQPPTLEGTMQGESVQWDLRSMWCHPSVMSQFLLLYLLAFIVVIIRTVWKAWLIVSPFRSKTPDSASKCQRILNSGSRRLSGWTQLSFLLWGIHTCGHIGAMLRGWLLERSHIPTVWWCDVQDFSGTSGAILTIVAVAFLVRWRFELRVERLNG